MAGDWSRVLQCKDVELIGKSLGKGRYGAVSEAVIAGAKCAAKRIAFDSPGQAQLANGCELWNSLRHPNIVQFLGVYLEPDSSVLLMELFATNLHHLLKSPQRMPLSLKISILQNIVCGLAYLHNQIPKIVHGRLSAKKVLLDSGAVAKISVGVGVTVLPQKLELSPYMPPEVTGETSTKTVAVDVFSVGVLMLSTVSDELPNRILPPTYTDESKGLCARTELERRAEYMEIIYSQLGQEHPLVQLITKCLNNQPESRAFINDIRSLLWQAGVLAPDSYWEKTKTHVIQDMTALASNHLQMKDLFESQVRELRGVIRGLLQGMAKQRKMLPRRGYEDEDKELVTEEEIAYIVTFVEGIEANKLGRELGLSEDSLKIIDYDYARKCDENLKRVEVLTQWIRNCDSPTWSALVDALSSIGQKKIANIISKDKGLLQQCPSGIVVGVQSTPNMRETSEVVVRDNSPQTANNSSTDGPDVIRLKSQLARATKAQESAESKLAEIRKEMSETCDSHEKELAGKAKEIRKLKMEIKAEEQLRKEMDEENLKLKLELEQLKRK